MILYSHDMTADSSVTVYEIGDVELNDGEINSGCGNLDYQTKAIYTTPCLVYKKGYICQYTGVSFYIYFTRKLKLWALSPYNPCTVKPA